MSQLQVYVPTRGYVWHKTAARLGLASPIYVQVNTGVVDARHLIVAAFLKSSADILVMCDDDVVPPENWQEIAYHIHEGRTDVCAAVCPIALEGTVFLPNVFIRDDSLARGYRISAETIRETGLQTVDAVGTGLMAIHRRVLQDRHLKNPFKASFVQGGGEDVNFCRRAKGAGWEVKVDFDIWCEHRVEVNANQLAQSYTEIVNRAFEEEAHGSE